MKTTGIFTLHTFEIKLKKWGDSFTIVPFGDVHRHAPNCNVEKWKAALKIMKKLPNPYFLGMGDYDDIASASERVILANPKLHTSTKVSLDHFVDSMTTEIAGELSFMKGRLIGLLGGNHYYEYPTGINSDQDLCRRMDCKYLGVSAGIRLCVKVGKDLGNYVVDIWAHHGKGASRLVGGSINRVEQMREACHADVYIMGHDHKRAAVPVTVFEFVNGSGGLRMHHKKQWLVRSGSFLGGYVDGEISYVADAAMSPVDQGFVVLTATATRSGAGGVDKKEIDIHALI